MSNKNPRLALNARVLSNFIIRVPSEANKIALQVIPTIQCTDVGIKKKKRTKKTRRCVHVENYRSHKMTNYQHYQVLTGEGQQMQNG